MEEFACDDPIEELAPDTIVAPLGWMDAAYTYIIKDATEISITYFGVVQCWLGTCPAIGPRCGLKGETRMYVVYTTYCVVRTDGADTGHLADHHLEARRLDVGVGIGDLDHGGAMGSRETKVSGQRQVP